MIYRVAMGRKSPSKTGFRHFRLCWISVRFATLSRIGTISVYSNNTCTCWFKQNMVYPKS